MAIGQEAFGSESHPGSMDISTTFATVENALRSCSMVGLPCPQDQERICLPDSGDRDAWIESHCPIPLLTQGQIISYPYAHKQRPNDMP